MFVPVIFDISPDREARYLGEFYHWLSVMSRNAEICRYLLLFIVILPLVFTLS